MLDSKGSEGRAGLHSGAAMASMASWAWDGWCCHSLCVVPLVATFAATYHLPPINDSRSTDTPRPRRHQLHHCRVGGPGPHPSLLIPFDYPPDLLALNLCTGRARDSSRPLPVFVRPAPETPPRVESKASARMDD
ncbi:hypothetical protein Mapa_000562 [Marchantia paleacea]|nr:hypothetical protein Mapa_000562 [Marchantia paleacea]